jgi:hypothetical protein
LKVCKILSLVKIWLAHVNFSSVSLDMWSFAETLTHEDTNDLCKIFTILEIKYTVLLWM